MCNGIIKMLSCTLIGVGYIVLGLVSGLIADAFHIDVKPRSSLDYNGRMVRDFLFSFVIFYMLYVSRGEGLLVIQLVIKQIRLN